MAVDPTPKYSSVPALKAILTESQLAQLTDDTSLDDGASDSTLVRQFLVFAESTAEGYVQGRYSLPLNPPPPSFLYAVLVIAKYRLFLRRQYMDEDTREEYTEVKEWLRSVRDDEVDLYARDSNSDDENDRDVSFGTSGNTYFDGQFFL
jgi:phage gp36-like protein